MLNLSNQRVNEQLWEHYPLRTLHNLPRLNASRRLGQFMILMLVGAIITLFMPWQQNITGEGTLTALSPKDRPQTIQNAIAGRIDSWHVAEGDKVKKGDTLLVISEIKDEYFDPNLPTRLDEQLQAKQSSMDATEAKISALSEQQAALRSGLSVKLASARNKVTQTRYKVNSDSTELVAARNFYQTARTRLERFEEAYRNGLISLTELETRRLKAAEDQAKVVAQQNKLNSTRQELANALLDLSEIQADYADKLAKSLSEQSSAVSYRADATGEVAKLQNKISSVDVRRGLYIVRAPQEGYVVRALKAGIGETIKEGESIATLQPVDPGLAVEMYVRAMDVPLITPGRKVRLEFDGWPAVQFSGWPTVAVGTFGGVVAVVDAVSSVDGRYRLLVRPDKNDQPWPAQLRQGSGVFGWVMLDDVPIWYELWRQLNGFPPSLKKEPTNSGNPKK